MSNTISNFVATTLSYNNEKVIPNNMDDNEINAYAEQLTTLSNQISSNIKITAKNPYDTLPVVLLCLMSLNNALESRVKVAGLQDEEIKKINEAMDALQSAMRVLNDLGGMLDKETAKDKAAHINEKGRPDANYTWNDMNHKLNSQKDVDLYDLNKVLTNNGSAYGSAGWNINHMLNSPLGKFLVLNGYIKVTHQSNVFNWGDWDNITEDAANTFRAGKDVDYTNWSLFSHISATDKLKNGILDTTKMTGDELTQWNAIDKGKNIGDYYRADGSHVNYDYFTLSEKRTTTKEEINEYYSDKDRKNQITLNHGEIALDLEIFKDMPADFKKYTQTVYDEDGKIVNIVTSDALKQYMADALQKAGTILCGKSSVNPENVFGDMTGTSAKVKNAVDYMQKQYIDAGLSSIQQNLTKQLESLQEEIQKYLDNFMAALNSNFRQ